MLGIYCSQSWEGLTLNSLKNRVSLTGLRQKALRNGIWFRALSSVERGLANLSIRYVKEPRNNRLIGALEEIVNKLTSAINMGFLYFLGLRGRQIAEERVEVATKWGNQQARAWKSDQSFWQFLGLNANFPSWRGI